MHWIFLGSIEQPTNTEWTYDIILPYENNIATEITIKDENLFPTGYYELTFDFFQVSISPILKNGYVIM